MNTLHKRPYGRAFLALLAFMVVVALLETLLYLIFDFSTFFMFNKQAELPEIELVIWNYMLFFIKSAGLAFLLGLFVAVRVLRMRPSLFFTLLHASLLWFLVLLSRAVILSIYLAKTYGGQWSDGLKLMRIWETFKATNTFDGIVLALLLWLVAVALCWWFLRILKII